MSANTLAVTPSEAQVMRELRAEGRTCRDVADMVGRCEWTVQVHAPGRIGKVSNISLREAFLASPYTATDVAREIGWWDRGNLDGSRVKRALGINTETSHGKRYRRHHIDIETAERIAYAIGVMPWTLWSDDEGEAAT